MKQLTQSSIIQSQKGAALLIALVLLLVLTLIGVSSMQTTTMEERMVANQKDYYLAFEAAEFALAAAEDDLGVLFSTGGFTPAGAGGLYMNHSVDDYVWETVDWTDNTKVVFVDPHPGMTTEPPKYIVERLTVVSERDAVNLGNEYGEQTGATEVTIFRVTARGASGRGSVVFLQSTFGQAI